MEWRQREITLPARSRGVHLVTDEIMDQLPEVSSYDVGLLHLFIQHTSASLTLNENASPAVRTDLENHFRRMVPDGLDEYTHTVEGPDDMPAHIKASMLDTSVTIPLSNGRLRLGTWQGVFLWEHRNQGRPRTLVATIYGVVSESV